MRFLAVLLCVGSLGALAACSSPQERAAEAQERSYEAQEELVRQRMEFVEKYQQCVDDAAGDQMKVEACDSYLRSAEALK